MQLSSYIASNGDSKYLISENIINNIEQNIDLIDSKLPILKNFILPGGSIESSFVHVSRSISRRVERHYVKFSKDKSFDPLILAYFNRLSDFLFVLARHTNKLNNFEDVIIKIENKI